MINLYSIRTIFSSEKAHQKKGSSANPRLLHYPRDLPVGTWRPPSADHGIERICSSCSSVTRAEPLAPLPRLLYKSGLTLSPDRRWFLFTRVDHYEADIMLME